MTIGALLELTARGKEDVILTKNPSFSYFTGVYKKHTDFAIQNIRVQFNETPDFDKLVRVFVPRHGDLLSDIYLHLILPPLSIASGSTYTGWTNAIGHAIIDYIELWIGGIRIDKQYGLWMEVWDELTLPESYRAGKKIAIGNFDNVTNTHTNATVETEYFVPLPFWFNRRKALAFPLVALQYQKIEFRLKFRPFIECVTFDGNINPTKVPITCAEYIMEYYYLAPKERDMIAKSDATYLYEELQFSERESVRATGNTKYVHRTSLKKFNNSLKNVVWAFSEQESIDNNDWFNFSRRADITNLVTSARLLLNGEEREEVFTEGYHRLAQPMSHHTRVPNKHIYTLSFSLFPESKEPSGSLNASKFDEIDMEFIIRNNNPASVVYVWTLSWNIIVITKCTASRLFSN